MKVWLNGAAVYVGTLYSFGIMVILVVGTIPARVRFN